METPKTLRKAIFDAFEAKKVIVSAELMVEIEARIKDYCAQKFQLYRDPENENIDLMIKSLWRKIFGEKLQ